MKFYQKKFRRYRNLFRRVINWGSYLLFKIVGFRHHFVFNIKGLGRIKVVREMFGPFRENFLDDIYYCSIPENIFNNKSEIVIIDIGANVGFFSLASFSKFPTATIYAFEPHPYCFEVMTEYQNTHSNYNWLTFQEAIGPSDGEVRIHTNTISGFATMSSVLQNDSRSETFIAKSTKLSSFISDLQVETIDLLKLDCEGAEYDIIYSLPDELFQRITALSIETHRGESPKDDPQLLNAYLLKMGYSTKVLDNGTNTGYIWAWKVE